MNRHQRRKRALERKAEKLRHLESRAAIVRAKEIAAKAFADPYSRFAKRSPKGMGNRGIYGAFGMFPAPGFGTGAFKERPQSERQLRELRSQGK